MSGLDQEFPGKIVCRNVDATTQESKRAVGDLDFKNHGLVIRSPEGEALWKQPDHEVDMDAVRTAIRDLVSD